MDSQINTPSRSADLGQSFIPVPIHPKPPIPGSVPIESKPESNTTVLISHASTHGHLLSEIEPMAKHSGSSVSTFFNGLFQTILAISTLGASITFNYVLSNNSSPDPPTPILASRTFSASTVQLFLAISWLLFLLALAFAAMGQTLLTFFKKHWEEDWDGKRGKTSQKTIQLYAVAASALMGALVVGAFALLCLVVVAYSPVVGWIALGFTSFFALVMLFSIGNQVPWPWKDNTPTIKPVKRVSV